MLRITTADRAGRFGEGQGVKKGQEQMNEAIKKILEQYKVARKNEEAAGDRLGKGEEASRRDYYYWNGSRATIEEVFRALFPGLDINEEFAKFCEIK